MAAIGVPSTSGVMGALTDYGVGAVGGVAYRLLSGLIPGGPLIGGALAAAGVGSFVKGTRGEVLATMLGFQAGIGFDGLGALGGGGDNAVEVM